MTVTEPSETPETPEIPETPELSPHVKAHQARQEELAAERELHNKLRTPSSRIAEEATEEEAS